MYSLCRERGGSYLGFCVCLWAYSGSSSKGTIFWQTFNSHLADFIDCGSRSASELRLEFCYNCCCLSNQVRSMVYSLPCSVLHRRSKVVLAHFSSSSLTSSPFLVRTILPPTLLSASYLSIAHVHLLASRWQLPHFSAAKESQSFHQSVIVPLNRRHF